MRLGHRAYWSFNLYPDAGEGGGCFVPTLRARPWEGNGQAVDVERSQVEAGRRARGKVRRFCAANRLNRLATLTYAGEGCFDQAQLRVDVALFFRGLRDALGGAPFPYLWVPEWHLRHGLHAHFGVGQYVSQRLIRDVWGHGITHITLIGDLPVGSGELEEARVTGGYLGKYVSKNINDDRISRLHRYEVAQGFQPVKLPLAGESEEAVIAHASERMGSEPVRGWRSAEQEGWRGPPAYWRAWAG